MASLNEPGWKDADTYCCSLFVRLEDNVAEKRMCICHMPEYLSSAQQLPIAIKGHVMNFEWKIESLALLVAQRSKTHFMYKLTLSWETEVLMGWSTGFKGYDLEGHSSPKCLSERNKSSQCHECTSITICCLRYLQIQGLLRVHINTRIFCCCSVANSALDKVILHLLS